MNRLDTLDAFGEMGDVKERSLSAKEQKELIQKMQNEEISIEEKNVLMGSLYNLVIGVARSFASRFPDRSLEDLVNDGLFNLWLRLPTYSPVRSVPSTFTQLVVQSAYCKELKKLQRRSIKKIVIEDDEEKEINIPHMSLSNFQNADGQEFEPDVLGVEDEKRQVAEDMLEFESMIEDMYKEVCKSIQEYRILNYILNTKLLPNYGGGRRRKSLNKIAEMADTKFNHVEKVAKRVTPWLKKHDFIYLLSSQTFKIPPVENIFSEEHLDEYFQDNKENDVWDILHGRI